MYLDSYQRTIAWFKNHSDATQRVCEAQRLLESTGLAIEQVAAAFFEQVLGVGF